MARGIRKFILVLTAATIVVAAVLLLFRKDNVIAWDAVGQHYFIRNSFRVVNPFANSTSKVFDLDNNGVDEAYFLENGKLVVDAAGSQIWETDDLWRVTWFGFGDVDGDHITDLVLDVWKPGNFGPSHPFWEIQDDSIRNHVFVFDLVGGHMKAKWQSSNLAHPNYSLQVADLNHDGKAELLTGEGEYGDAASCLVRRYGVWQWGGWGFVKEWGVGK